MRQRDYQVQLGPKAVVRCNSNLVFEGLFIMIVGLPIYFLVPEWLHLEEYQMFFAFIAILMEIIGLAVFISAFSRSMENIYLLNGYCQIVTPSSRCGGGCTRCPFAKQYIERINAEYGNKETDESDDGFWIDPSIRRRL